MNLPNISALAKPSNQAIFIAIIALPTLFVMRLLFSLNIQIDNDDYWTVAAAFLLIYAVMNTVASFEALDSNQYWLRSIPLFALLAALLTAVAWLLTGNGPTEAHQIVCFFLTFAYLLMLSIGRIIRGILLWMDADGR